MSKLDELIAELCPDGVEYIPLGEVLKNNNAPYSIPKKYYKDNGDIPIIDQSQVYIAGYTDDESAVPPILPCIIFGDHTRVVKYADRKFAQGDSGTKVFIPVTEDLNTKYIYYAFCNIDIPSRGYNRHWTIAKNIKIPIPPLPVQQEIVRILDTFTELIKELNAELEARKKQYEYYRDLLLTFDDEVEWIAELCPDGVEYKKLKEVASVSIGEFVHKNKQNPNGVYPVYNGGTSNTGFYDEFNRTANKIIISARGANAGFVNRVFVDFWAGNSCYTISVEEKYLDWNFTYYVLKSSENNLINQQQKGGIPAVSKKQVEEFYIPLPPLPVQQEIVRILDTFTELIKELNAELEARKKQYEYYLNKLLDFKEVSS